MAQFHTADAVNGVIQLTTPSLSPPPVGLTADTGSFETRLPGGNSGYAMLEVVATSQYTVLVKGYTSPTKPSFNRPIIGYPNGILVDTDRTLELDLTSSGWTLR